MTETFIGEYIISNPSICDELIEYFKNHPDKYTGMVGGVGNVNKKIKDSTDLSLGPNDSEVVRRYVVDELSPCLKSYIKKYKWSDKGHSNWNICENINIQHYKPGGGYYEWHSERQKSNARHLVFMTYLNDVMDAGGTEFYYYDIIGKPIKGSTLIWPAFWPHTHRGIQSKTEEKYIITGWYSYLE